MVRMRVKMERGAQSLGAPLPPRHCLFPWKQKVRLCLQQRRKEVKTPVTGGMCEDSLVLRGVLGLCL